MRRGWVFSVCVHALVLLAVLFGLPFFRSKPREIPPMISVDVVDMAKEATTNKISPANKVEKQAREDTPPPPQAQPQPTPEPPKPREAVDTSIPKLAAVDSSAAPELKAPDENLRRPLDPLPTLPSVDTKVADIAAPAKVDLKRPQPKENFDSVLKNLAKLKPQDTAPQQQPAPKAEPKPATGALAPLSDKLTQSELAALIEQLSHCWNMPAGVKDAQNLVVDLDVEVNPDRTVASVQIEDQGRLASDPVFRAAAMSAARALRMPECTPLALPPDKYEQWKSMSLHFNPKEMLGL